MEFELSQKMMKVCRTSRLKPEALAFCDLVAAGWEPADAYIVAFRKGATWIKKALKTEVEKLLETEDVKNRITLTKFSLRQSQEEKTKNATNKERKDVVSEALSKEAMIYDLQTALRGMKQGSKEWIDTKKMIIDVTRMKQDEVKDETSTIHYYLPVQYPTGCQDCLYSKCDTCKFKKAYEEK
jgi:uncharacterized protein YdaT